MKRRQPAPQKITEAAESRLLIQYAFDLARQLRIEKVLVLADLVQDRKMVERHRETESLIWVGHGGLVCEGLPADRDDYCVEIPEGNLGRLAQVNLGLIMAALHKYVSPSETVVCLTGLAGSKRLDNLLITNVKRDYPWFQEHNISKVDRTLTSREFVRLIDISVRLAAEGREGNALGTMFVLGDPSSVEKHVRQLILNPLAGHPQRTRSIHRPEFVETVRELAAVDGGFLVDRKGIVRRAGVYFGAPMTPRVKVAKGLGARHTAAAAISARASCLAVVISQSSRTVSVYSKGSLVLSIRRPGE
jgi:hypothetical protein